jgi:hypothetical protein
MNRYTCRWAAGLVLALAALVLPSVRADDEEEMKLTREAGVDVAKLVDAMKDKMDGDKKDAEAIVKKHGLDYVMYQFKPRERGGLGLGVKGTIKPDGIELKIKDLTENKMSAADLKKQGPALIRAAQVASVLSDMASVTTPPKAKPGTPASAWATYSADMKKGAKEFAEAVKGGKPDVVQKAALNLNASCTGCHSAYR